MDMLTPDQARALWDAGGFFILTGLPQGSEYGIDGTFNVVRTCSGTKFVPPGLHLLTWSASTPSPSGVPLRSGLLRVFAAKERVAFAYSSSEEDASPADTPSDAELVALDAALAPYPFAGLARWKALTTHITAAIVNSVLPGGIVDALMSADGDEGAAGRTMRFPVFDLKKSWPTDAVGSELTRHAQDKSWLLGSVAAKTGPTSLIAHLQLAFVLVLYLSSSAALDVYRRFLSLLARAPTALLDPAASAAPFAPAALRRAYLALIHTLAAQLLALPDNVFDADLPEMDVFCLGEIAQLGRNVGAALAARRAAWGDVAGEVERAWAALQRAGRRWGWAIDDLGAAGGADDSDEEGEYAPIVVEP
ncbi:hypothetical protein Q5752_003398 [Cryptotrichosporon argae]